MGLDNSEISKGSICYSFLVHFLCLSVSYVVKLQIFPCLIFHIVFCSNGSSATLVLPLQHILKFSNFNTTTKLPETMTDLDMNNELTMSLKQCVLQLVKSVAFLGHLANTARNDSGVVFKFCLWFTDSTTPLMHFQLQKKFKYNIAFFAVLFT